MSDIITQDDNHQVLTYYTTRTC